ncbi:isoleucine--tRNA ligase [Ruminococcaceae bacterium OttesenSCG-928-D13]|nr:isoleucine--tRNA ligase [Ruminococcaceae bacterium OttesenSCG-928-D13]
MNLPKTDFDMRAGLPKKEPGMLKEWQDIDLYNKMIAANDGKPLYLLHDGPPYANADIHMGTAMNKVIKDIIVRYKNMSGFKAPYVPGWDCHGLPIERRALEKVKADREKKGEKPHAHGEGCACGHDHSNEEENRYGVTDYELREICNDFAMHYVGVQREQFERLGVLGDWEHPYLTLTPDFEANQIAVFGEMAKKGYIYKGLKPVYWCPQDRTALAEAEIEYEEEDVESIYVAFQTVKDNGALEKAGLPVDKCWFVIWTTTTWTLPGNVAICLGPRYEYVAAKVGERFYIVAKELLEPSMEACGITDYEVVAEFVGKDLDRIETKHCWLDRNSLVIMGDHVTLESGTGCVHTAPGHGVEDYDVVVRHYPELPIIVPVDDDGLLTEEAGPQFTGLSVFKASPVIQKALAESGHLVGAQKITHTYPHCWRCHSPIIFRATKQWFCSVEDFREDTYKAIDSVKWIPAWGHGRMMGMVRDRADWCISRQRLWGVPIPVFYCDDCGEYVIDDTTIGAVHDLFAKEGSNAWFKYEAAEILPKGYACPKCGGTAFTKERDTMDVWFDSGTSWETVLGKNTPWADHQFPSDLYLEGSDQYRGWFQSSLLTSVATRGVSPYKNVVSCGWVVDGEGRKMSKSLGNGIAPEEVISQYGADIVRLWVAASDYQVDVRISKDILKQLSEAYRKIRNTARFILGNLGDFDPDKDSVDDDELTSLDKWALAELDKLVALAHEGYNGFDFHKVYHNLHRFCVVSMSNFYLDIIKDRLYVTETTGKSRRAAQTTMFRILVALTEMLAPILAYTAQEIWSFIPAFAGKQEYVVLHDIPKAGLYQLPAQESEKWDRIIAVTADVKKVLETARAAKEIGSSLEAKVVLHTDDDGLYSFIEGVQDQLADIFIVSQVELERGGGGTAGEVESLGVEVRPADGQKCERCWQYHTDVGADPAHATLCGRCAAIIGQ